LDSDRNALQKISDLASQKINEGHFDEALVLARKIQGLGPNCLVSYIVSRLLIDIGSSMRNVSLIEEGLQVLQKDFEEIGKHPEFVPTANYNLANAYMTIFEEERAKNPRLVLFNKTKLDDARRYYKRAINSEPKDKTLLAQIFVNLGNCFDDLGRVIDALECYDQALTLKPDLGMASGNKGMALLNYAALCGEHQGTFTLEAYTLLTTALKQGVYPEAASSFLQYIKLMEKEYPKLPLQNPLGYPGYKIKARSTFEKFLTDFCLQNKLYLNICFFCKKCDATIGDTAIIRTMIVTAKDYSYLTLSSYLNQIKQDYVVARFLLILSRYEKLDLDFVDKRVTIINTLDYSVHNIYVQLVKTAFKTFYDILDKIAFFINDYLKLGIPDREIDFTKVWYSDNKRTIRTKIADSNNVSLNALFDIHRELDYGEKNVLKRTRNALTHRFVNVRIVQESENDENMTESTLVLRTLELAKTVRNSVMYLLHFVNVEETKKQMKIQGPTLPLLAHALPDKLKGSRKKPSKRRRQPSA
jgi:tetratricopeptide (TPR) repeat protein